MSQIQTTKVHGWVAFGPPDGTIMVPKVHGWVLLVPGDDSGEQPQRQGFCYGQRVRRG